MHKYLVHLELSANAARIAPAKGVMASLDFHPVMPCTDRYGSMDLPSHLYMGDSALVATALRDVIINEFGNGHEEVALLVAEIDKVASHLGVHMPRTD